MGGPETNVLPPRFPNMHYSSARVEWGGEDLATGHVSRGLRHTHGTQRWLFGGESVLELMAAFMLPLFVAMPFLAIGSASSYLLINLFQNHEFLLPTVHSFKKSNKL